MPSIRWYKDEIEVSPEIDDRYSLSYNSKVCILNISSLREDDSGRYICEATNKAGRVSTFARICIVDDPKILKADAELKR